MQVNEVTEKYMTMDRSRGVEDLQRVRLRALLSNLVRDVGRAEAAVLLGVNYKTVSRAMESEDLTDRMSDALEWLLLTGGVPVLKRHSERIEGLEQGMQGLADRLDALEKEMRNGFEEVRIAVENEVEALRETVVQVAPGLELQSGRVEAGQSEQRERGDSLPGAALPRARAGRKRDEPLVLTEEPEADDEEFYGPVWPLISEWRELRATHPNHGSGLAWLKDEERLMEVEVSLLEDHGFTHPPETQELRGFARSGQLNWRKKALIDTRRARIRRERLHRVRRILTFGRWRK